MEIKLYYFDTGYIEFDSNDIFYEGVSLTKTKPTDDIIKRLKVGGQFTLISGSFDIVKSKKDTSTLNLLTAKIEIDSVKICDGTLNLRTTEEKWNYKEKTCSLSFTVVDQYQNFDKNKDNQYNILNITDKYSVKCKGSSNYKNYIEAGSNLPLLQRPSVYPTIPTGDYWQVENKTLLLATGYSGGTYPTNEIQLTSACSEYFLALDYLVVIGTNFPDQKRILQIVSVNTVNHKLIFSNGTFDTSPDLLKIQKIYSYTFSHKSRFTIDNAGQLTYPDNDLTYTLINTTIKDELTIREWANYPYPVADNRDYYDLVTDTLSQNITLLETDFDSAYEHSFQNFYLILPIQEENIIFTPLLKNRIYEIAEAGGNFTNVGASNNNIGTFFYTNSELTPTLMKKVNLRYDINNQTYIYRNCRLLIDSIKYLATHIDNSISFDETGTETDSFYYLYENDLELTMIADISDVISPTASNVAEKCMIKFQDIMNYLKTFAAIYFEIDENKVFRLIHLSEIQIELPTFKNEFVKTTNYAIDNEVVYLENKVWKVYKSLSNSNVGNIPPLKPLKWEYQSVYTLQMNDLTKCNGQNITTGLDEYSYSYERNNKFIHSQLKSGNLNFIGVPMTFPNVAEGVSIEYNEGIVLTDVNEIQNNTSNFSKTSGQIVLLHCEKTEFTQEEIDYINQVENPYDVMTFADSDLHVEKTSVGTGARCYTDVLNCNVGEMFELTFDAVLNSGTKPTVSFSYLDLTDLITWGGANSFKIIKDYTTNLYFNFENGSSEYVNFDVNNIVLKKVEYNVISTAGELTGEDVVNARLSIANLQATDFCYRMPDKAAVINGETVTLTDSQVKKDRNFQEINANLACINDIDMNYLCNVKPDSTAFGIEVIEITQQLNGSAIKIKSIF